MKSVLPAILLFRKGEKEKRKKKKTVVFIGWTSVCSGTVSMFSVDEFRDIFLVMGQRLYLFVCP